MSPENAVDLDLDHTTLPSMTGPLAVGPASDAPLLAPGDRVGDWVVDGHLGCGSVSQVYAVTGMLGGVPRRVALKLIHVAGEPAFGESILREAYALTAFSHPGLIQALAVWQADAGEPLDGAVAVLLPLAEFSLAEYLRRLSDSGQWRMTESAVCSGAAEIARALAYLHRSGKPDGSAVVVHNDVKPENVLQIDGRWVLADLGISSPPGGGDLPDRAGSLSYLAPEYLTDPPAGKHPAGDIWAFGVLLHRWLTSQYPFPGASPAARAAAVRDGHGPSLAIGDPGLADLVASMLARSPVDRPSAAEVARHLRSAAGQPASRKWRRALDARLPIAAIALAVGAATGAGVDAVFVAGSPPPPISVASYGFVKSLKPGRPLGLRVRPHSTSATVSVVPDGTPMPILCTSRGDRVPGNWGQTDLWDKVLYHHIAGWVSDGLLYTGTNSAVAPPC